MDTGLLPMATLGCPGHGIARRGIAQPPPRLYELAGRLRGPDDQCARARSPADAAIAPKLGAQVEANVAFDVG